MADSKAVASPDAQAGEIERTITSVMAEQERERQDIARSVADLRDTTNKLQQSRIDALGRVRDRRARFSELIRRVQLLDTEAARQEMEITASIRAGMVAAALVEGDAI